MGNATVRGSLQREISPWLEAARLFALITFGCVAYLGNAFGSVLRETSFAERVSGSSCGELATHLYVDGCWIFCAFDIRFGHAIFMGLRPFIP